MNKTPIKLKIKVVDEYLSFEHKLYSGTECEAIPQYTSTKKLKGYKVKSKTNGKYIFVNGDEVELQGS